MKDRMKDEDALPTQADALSVLLEVSQEERVRESHPLVAEFIGHEDLESIVNIAWRYQFIEDRYSFKKDMKDLQANVTRKIVRGGDG